jgi:cation diffusion facilitator family transporter
MKWVRYYQPNHQVGRMFRRAMVVTLIGNLLLAGIKIAAAKFSGSSAIYSDAVNSISDVLYSVLLIVGLWISQQPPDMSHPQGHSRFEPFTALIVTISMTIAGVEALRASIQRAMEGGAAIPLGISLLALVVSMLIKAVMYAIVHRISRQTASPGLDAAAKDNLSDVITSLAALLGIVGSNFISPLLDPLAGVAVALWIFKAVYGTAKENLGYLTGAGADEEVRNRILDSVKDVPGLEDVHHIVTEYAGPKLVVEMHVNVDGNKTLNEAHAICDQATERLEALPEVDRAYVHVEPLGYL